VLGAAIVFCRPPFRLQLAVLLQTVQRGEQTFRNSDDADDGTAHLGCQDEEGRDARANVQRSRLGPAT
jgi:hypothetical protein